MNAYTQPQPPRHQPSETAAQHMRMLCRLAELGMSLAEIAAEDAAAADPTSEPAPQPHPPAERPRTPTRPEHILAFTRVSRIVTAAISLHAALEAGPKPALRTRSTAEEEPETDYRAQFLEEAFAEVGQLNPHLQISQQDASRALAARLAAPEHGEHGFATLAALFAQVAADIGLPPHLQPGPVYANLFEKLAQELPPEPPD